MLLIRIVNSLQEKAVEATKQKEEKRKNLSPRNRKACHSVGTALLKSVAEIGTQSDMKSSRKTLHELTSHIPPKTPKRNRSKSTNKGSFALLIRIICKRKCGAIEYSMGPAGQVNFAILRER
jgi:hypothetical protein